MKKAFWIVGLAIWAATVGPVSAVAQTFSDAVQKSAPGQGIVVIHQSQELADLLNGRTSTTVSNRTKPAAADVKPTDNGKEDKKTDTKSNTSLTTQNKDGNDDNTGDDKSSVLRNKAYRSSYAVKGYRVQIYSGDDSRAARQRANALATEFKGYFPDIPAYTHFYSPHWTCRVGDFRTYEEANACLNQIRRTNSFKAAAIIKCTVRVSY